MTENTLILIAGVAIGFAIRHWYPGKWRAAEATADRVKSEWDKRQ